METTATTPNIYQTEFIVGGFFRPYKVFTMGSWIPEPLSKFRGLSPGAKLVWARLARYQGESGEARPAVAALANDVGLSRTQVKYYLRQLRDKHFIEITGEQCYPDGGRVNVYEFLWHAAFEGERGAARMAPVKVGGVSMLTGGGGQHADYKESQRERESTPDRKGCAGSAALKHTAAPKNGAGDFDKQSQPPIPTEPVKESSKESKPAASPEPATDSEMTACPWSLPSLHVVRHALMCAIQQVWPDYQPRRDAERMAWERVKDGVVPMDATAVIAFIDTNMTTERMRRRESGLDAERYILGCLGCEAHPASPSAADYQDEREYQAAIAQQLRVPRPDPALDQATVDRGIDALDKHQGIPEVSEL